MMFHFFETVRHIYIIKLDIILFINLCFIEISEVYNIFEGPLRSAVAKEATISKSSMSGSGGRQRVVTE
jgi:hypothetical protein